MRSSAGEGRKVNFPWFVKHFAVGRCMEPRTHIPPGVAQRPGWTVVELLVACAVVGLLLALLLPAIQAVRARSQRLDCSNRLRQLALAAAAYSNDFQSLPPGLSELDDRQVVPGGLIAPTVALLPWLGAPSCSRFLRDKTTSVPELSCPSEVYASAPPRLINFVANVSPGENSGYAGRGPFQPLRSRPVRLAEVVDGFSQSALFGEAVEKQPNAGLSAVQAANDPKRYAGWSVDIPWLSEQAYQNPSSPEALEERRQQTEASLEACLSGPRALHPRTASQLTPRTLDQPGHTGHFYTHWYPINTADCMGPPGQGDEYFLLLNNGVSSYHRGGVNIAYLDGHVAFVSENIDRRLWRGAGTIDGNEQLED